MSTEDNGNERSARIETSLRELARSMDKLSGRFDALDNRLDQFGQNLAVTRAELLNLQGRVSEVERVTHTGNGDSLVTRARLADEDRKAMKAAVLRIEAKFDRLEKERIGAKASLGAAGVSVTAALAAALKSVFGG